MTNALTDALDPAAAVRNAIAKLTALQPRVAELEKVDANLVAARSFLRKAKDEFTALVAERDRARADIVEAKRELAVQTDLAQRHKEHDALDRQIKQMKGQVR